MGDTNVGPEAPFGGREGNNSTSEERVQPPSKKRGTLYTAIGVFGSVAALASVYVLKMNGESPGNSNNGHIALPPSISSQENIPLSSTIGAVPSVMETSQPLPTAEFPPIESLQEEQLILQNRNSDPAAINKALGRIINSTLVYGNDEDLKKIIHYFSFGEDTRIVARTGKGSDPDGQIDAFIELIRQQWRDAEASAGYATLSMATPGYRETSPFNGDGLGNTYTALTVIDSANEVPLNKQDAIIRSLPNDVVKIIKHKSSVTEEKILYPPESYRFSQVFMNTRTETDKPHQQRWCLVLADSTKIPLG